MLARKAKLDKFKKLREARRTGRIDASDDEDASIYDEVDEDTFRQHKRDQLMNDDFIVDDNGEGYVDNGVDEWDDATRPNYYSDEEAEAGPLRKRSKTHKVAKVTRTAEIDNFFAPAQTVLAPAAPKAPQASVDDILDDFVAPKSRVSKNRAFSSFGRNQVKTERSAGPFGRLRTSAPRKETKFDASSSPANTLDMQDFNDFNTAEDNGTNPQDETTDTPSTAANASLAQNESAKQASLASSPEPQAPESDSDEEVVVRRRAAAPARAHTASVTAVKAEAVVSPSRNSFAFTSSVPSSQPKVELDAVSSDDKLRMFWLDYAEADGSLLLFGKVLTPEGSLVSAMVQVHDMCRELYVLPRDDVSPMDVHAELVPILMEQFGLERLRAKPETRKYAFELPDVPKEAEYLKVLLPFKTKKNQHVVMPSELEGETFRRIFGTNTNVFESFVTQRNIMGPCWLDIRTSGCSPLQNASHCQFEAAISSPECISPVTNGSPAPNLTTTSISVQTVMNVKANRQEVVCVSLATYRDLPQDLPIAENTQPNELVTLVRPVGLNYPPGLQKAADAQNLNVRLLPNEKSLLSCLTALIKNADPDILVGHRLENISLDVLVHRMHDLKVPTWSTMGRRHRKSWPDKFGKSSAFSNNLLIREIFQGRLLCDIANELGQSLTPKCQSWDLLEMYNVVCHQNHPALEINFQNPRYIEDASFWLMPLKENVSQVLISAQISFALQILSLSKQLTNLAGNAWSHTLSGTRAGRNEFILLHEFRRNNYIVPDKEGKFHKNTSHQQDARIEATEDDATTVTSNKKPKYQGGLVFEPEKGLHKNYILVMDFNSLYPSIIQEFNICFTTVERDAYNTTHDEERDLPEIPERDSDQGVLPRLLNTLVSRRREVKKLLKDPKISAAERAQYDIKQQALKLTANSMYGCLGYVNSRFYAKPLAMLVTNKGREILMDTRQLAELIGLRVVYGDTDSVMIDTGATSMAEALKIGEEFKVQVNERYKLLEIDTDNVFKRLLLHAKKKYAAMNVTLDRKTGKEITSLEVKGLDMRRREYCSLSKEISTFVLEKLLSDIDPEEALSQVYGYLETTSAKIRANEFPVDKYLINTRLSKDPTSYPNGKTMPPVQVALRLRKQGKVVKAGSVITFIITAPKEGEESASPAERARAIQEVLGDRTNFKPDSEYYLEKQIYAPVERLVNKIEGVDMLRIASSLGIDTKKYAMRLRNTEGAEHEILPLESNISDVERFRQASYFVLTCKCGAKFRFGGIMASKDYKVTFNGVCCAKCDYVFPVLRLTSQLEAAIRKHLSLYYAGWLVCDDSACGIKTRQISVYGKRCIGASGKAHGCKGVMSYKYSDKALYNQLLYFDAIFDVSKAQKNQLRPIVYDVPVNPMSEGQLNALAEQNKVNFGYCREVVDQYLKVCGRRYVNMGNIFDFMV